MPGILIAVPTFETICPETFQSIWEMDGAKDCDFRFVKGYDCARARCRIAEAALKGDYERVLMIDSDVIVPQQTLTWMTESEADIVLGFCPKKNTKEKKSTIFKLGEFDFKTAYTYPELEGMSPHIPVHGGGFACALVKTKLFRDIPYPWFQFFLYADGTALSEDLFFCNEANHRKYRIEADTRVRCRHLTRTFQSE